MKCAVSGKGKRSLGAFSIESCKGSWYFCTTFHFDPFAKNIYKCLCYRVKRNFKETSFFFLSFQLYGKIIIEAYRTTFVRIAWTKTIAAIYIGRITFEKKRSPPNRKHRIKTDLHRHNWRTLCNTPVNISDKRKWIKACPQLRGLGTRCFLTVIIISREKFSSEARGAIDPSRW